MDSIKEINERLLASVLPEHLSQWKTYLETTTPECGTTELLRKLLGEHIQPEFVTLLGVVMFSPISTEAHPLQPFLTPIFGYKELEEFKSPPFYFIHRDTVLPLYNILVEYRTAILAEPGNLTVNYTKKLTEYNQHTLFTLIAFDKGVSHEESQKIFQAFTLLDPISWIDTDDTSSGYSPLLHLLQNKHVSKEWKWSAHRQMMEYIASGQKPRNPWEEPDVHYKSIIKTLLESESYLTYASDELLIEQIEYLSNGNTAFPFSIQFGMDLLFRLSENEQPSCDNLAKKLLPRLMELGKQNPTQISRFNGDLFKTLIFRLSNELTRFENLGITREDVEFFQETGRENEKNEQQKVLKQTSFIVTKNQERERILKKSIRVT